MKREAQGMDLDGRRPTAWSELEGFMRQLLSAAGDAMPKSENREPSKEEVSRRFRFEPRP